MQVTSIGHAGFRIDTQAGSVLCDPWVNPAYFGSWFVFPDNSGLDWAAIGDCDYLYISHLHKDHFDSALLAEHVNGFRCCAALDNCLLDRLLSRRDWRRRWWLIDGGGFSRCLRNRGRRRTG